MSINSKVNCDVNIRFLRREELSDVARLFNDAFGEGEFHARFMPNRHAYPHEYLNFTLHRFRTRFVQPGVRMVVAENAEGQVVGHATWIVEGESSLAARWRQATSWWWTLEWPLLKLEDWYLKYVINHCVDYAAIVKFRKLANENFEGLPPHLHLMILAVAPSQQGKGIGKAMLRWGLDIAEEEQMPVVLESSQLARPIYESMGFKTYKTVDMNHEIDGELKVPVMLWEPTSLAGKLVEEDGQGGWRRQPQTEI